MMKAKSFIDVLELFINHIGIIQQLLFKRVAKEQKQAIELSNLLKQSFETCKKKN